MKYINRILIDGNHMHVHYGYLLIELLISLLLFCIFSSLIMYIQFSSASSWRNTLQHKKALCYAQAHLDALLHKKSAPIIDEDYTITVKRYNFLPYIIPVNFAWKASLYQKYYSLISITCSWHNTNNIPCTITLTSGGIESYDK